MKLLLRQIEMPLEYSVTDLTAAAARRLGCRNNQILNCRADRRSLDARPMRTAPVFILSLIVEMSADYAFAAGQIKDVETITEEAAAGPALTMPANADFKSPIVVGAGPAGLMAALHLAEAGARPLLIERGARAEDRREVVDTFWRNGHFKADDNVLFGEGGAGLFSDGKLTARSKDRPRIRRFFEILVECGAHPEILIDAEPHLGSDVLLKIVPEIRRRILAAGGKISYNTTMTDILVSSRQISGIIAGGREISTDHLMLATGHSARDVYRLLGKHSASLQAKPFAVGVRLEVPQKLINKAQYGKFFGHPRLKPASFKLTRRAEGDARACYSFCMCPGGLVICCASESEAITTNGMSYSQRGSIWGNAAFIVPVEPADYAGCKGPEEHPEMAGLNFQLAIEKAAFIAGGGDFSVPALMLNDFLARKISQRLPENRSCPRACPASFDTVLPEFILKTLRIAIPRMLRELNGVDAESAILYAAETRSSSPVRIVRNDNGESPAIDGLFPVGEGAGYAGGIVSSAVDGLKTAEQVLLSLGRHSS